MAQLAIGAAVCAICLTCLGVMLWLFFSNSEFHED